MSKPKILIFAPREEPPETISALEGLGCELVFGNREWQLPRTAYEDTIAEAAREAVALMGTSIRHTHRMRSVGNHHAPNHRSREKNNESGPNTPKVRARHLVSSNEEQDQQNHSQQAIERDHHAHGGKDCGIE